MLSNCYQRKIKAMSAYTSKQVQVHLFISFVLTSLIFIDAHKHFLYQLIQLHWNVVGSMHQRKCPPHSSQAAGTMLQQGLQISLQGYQLHPDSKHCFLY